MKGNILYVVVPCYNEEEVLGKTSTRLKEKLSTLIKSNVIDDDSKVLFVDDGSKDKTWEIIKKLHEEDSIFSGIKLSHNRGHQNALVAGLGVASKRADMIISIDADLQDDINAIDKMVDEYLNNDCDVVYGVRKKRNKDTIFKKTTAEGYYKILKKFGVEVVFNHADYRLMSKRVVQALLSYKEVNLFLRGIVPQIGFKSTTVEYDRGERFAGESKYPLSKMLGLAVDGITSFSTKPLNLIFVFGIILFCLGFAGFVTTLVFYLLSMLTMFLPIIFFVTLALGIILMAIGVVGLYTGKTYMETKARPKYFIEEELD